jgi:hypothetical protein
MTTNLAEVRTTSALSRVFNHINKLEAMEHDVIALLPSLTDDQVMETRSSARLLYASAWKIEVACDAEIWDRTERVIVGRGNKDVDEKGIMAAVNKRAAELGCGASTILKNAQIFKRFKKTLTAESILDDKGFYQAALSADDPDEAIEEFAKQKSENPTYRVADAWKHVKKPAPPREDETKVLQSPEAQKWLTRLHKALLKLMPRVPDSAPFLKTMIQAMDGIVLQQSERTVEGDCRIIMKAIEESGGLSGDDLFDWQIEHFYFMSEEQLEDRLKLMEANKEILKDNAGKEGKQSKRRGKLPDFWVPFYVKRKKAEGAMCSKCDEWHRDPSDCLEI